MIDDIGSEAYDFFIITLTSTHHQYTGFQTFSHPLIDRSIFALQRSVLNSEIEIAEDRGITVGNIATRLCHIGRCREFLTQEDTIRTLYIIKLGKITQRFEMSISTEQTGFGNNFRFAVVYKFIFTHRSDLLQYPISSIDHLVDRGPKGSYTQVRCRNLCIFI